MKNSLALAPIAPAAIAAMSTADLRAELARAITVTAAHIVHLAGIWRELEHRGEDLSALRSGLWTYMPLIARGDLRAELLVKYAGYATLLRRLASLPEQDQDRLLEDDTVIRVVRKGDDFVEERVSVTQLRAAEIVQVINNRIVPPEDQRRRALSASHRPRPQSSTPRQRAMTRAQDDLAQPAPRSMTTALPMSEDEQEALRDAAKEAGVPMSRLIRAALIEAGLLRVA